MVILLNRFFLLGFAYQDAGLLTAVQACYNHVRLPFLLYPNSTVETLHQQSVAASACLTPQVCWHADSCRHRDLTRRLDILGSQFRVAPTHFLCLVKQSLNTLPRDLLNADLSHATVTNNES